MRKEDLYEIVKNFVKTRKEDPYAFFTASLQMRKFKISCCEDVTLKLGHFTYFKMLFPAVDFATWAPISKLKKFFGKVYANYKVEVVSLVYEIIMFLACSAGVL